MHNKKILKRDLSQKDYRDLNERVKFATDSTHFAKRLKQRMTTEALKDASTLFTLISEEDAQIRIKLSNAFPDKKVSSADESVS